MVDAFQPGCYWSVGNFILLPHIAKLRVTIPNLVKNWSFSEFSPLKHELLSQISSPCPFLTSDLEWTQKVARVMENSRMQLVAL